MRNDDSTEEGSHEDENENIYDGDHHYDENKHEVGAYDADLGLAGKKLRERIEDLLEMKLNMKRKIPLKSAAREMGSSSNAPPLIVTFEDQVSTILYRYNMGPDFDEE